MAFRILKRMFYNQINGVASNLETNFAWEKVLYGLLVQFEDDLVDNRFDVL